LDLRNNGGGYLDDAVRMAGLFYPVGPVVQVRSRNQSIESLDDREPSVSYAGPLVVMVNAASASASEIVAAALQDYGRAVVVGGSHTFGKGTVQKFDRFLSRDHELGAIKYTTQKFYRINGGSTQYLGVIPDIHLPDFTENYGITEKTLQNSLPWDTILPASYSKWPMPPNLKALSESSSARVSKDQHFAALQEILAYQNKRQKNTIQDLELAGARAEQKNMIEESKRFKDLKPTAEAKCLPLESYEDLPEDIRKQKENLRKEWFSQISGDLILSETLNVLSDMKK
jgi:carboxyl-terminal processing protease